MKASITKVITLALICVYEIVVNAAWAQVVTFSGQIIRHDTVDVSIPVSGTVYLHYAYSNEDTIEVPFFIQAGRQSTTYSKEVNWSLAGSVDEGHDYFRISVRCKERCEEANASDEFSFSYENDKTVRAAEVPRALRDDYRIEKYGENSRSGGYITNLKLLPKYGYVEGVLRLPEGLTAPSNLDIQLIGIDPGFASNSTFVQPFYQSLSFPIGSSEVSFRFQIELAKLVSPRFDDFTFGYQCISSACENLGLASDAILDSDGDRLYSNLFDFWDLAGLNFSLFYEESSFVFSLPKPITLLHKFNKGITIVQNRNKKEFDTDVEGRVVVEKLETSMSCSSQDGTAANELDFSLEKTCTDSYFLTKTMLVSATPFRISKGQEELKMDILVEEFDQIAKNNNGEFSAFTEIQRISVECDTGCDLIRPGYYRKNSILTSKSASGSKHFLLTKDFDQPIVISLGRPPHLPHVDLLLMEKD